LDQRCCATTGRICAQQMTAAFVVEVLA